MWRSGRPHKKEARPYLLTPSPTSEGARTLTKMEIEFYVVRTAYVTEAYTNLTDAKIAAKEVLRKYQVSSSPFLIIIERRAPGVCLIVNESSIRYLGREIATREDFDSATMEKKREFFIKDFWWHPDDYYLTKAYALVTCFGEIKESSINYSSIETDMHG